MMDFTVEEAQRLVGELTIQGRILARELAEAQKTIAELREKIAALEDGPQMAGDVAVRPSTCPQTLMRCHDDRCVLLAEGVFCARQQFGDGLRTNGHLVGTFEDNPSTEIGA